MSEICNRCGGVKSAITMLTAINHTALNNPNVSATHTFTGSTIQICYCSPENQPKHDGKLDTYALEDDHAEVWLERQAWAGEKQGIGLHVCGTKRDTYLDAKQSLSLLEWLKQEEETLKQLAKEQEQ